ncbi:MAG: RNA methyltransferase [Rubrobacter sp.]|nr:RNA methyltransferase [Rubrobacter sp.]MDQ3637687.1 RNA methyltransferase [Actinomycetota bacterium]
MTYSNATLKRLAKLKQKKHREVDRLFLTEGQSLVEEAPTPPTHLLTDPDAVRRLSTLTTPTGPIAAFPFLDVPAVELLEKSERIVLLHSVQDPGNVGTVIRAAHAFETGVALSTGTADLYNPKTVRGTMGSIFHTPIAREVLSLPFLEEAEASGFATTAAVPYGGERPSSLPAEKLVIVVGAEGAGLPEEVISACQQRVTIPALAASLNAAVAASILLYEAYNRVLP